LKISASIYSNKSKSLVDLVKELDNISVDMLHIDCNDDLAVFDDILKIREITDLPIDLHIITSNPENFYAKLKEVYVEYVTFQYENVGKPFKIPSDIKSKKGISIVTKTNLDVLKGLTTDFDFFLLMTTTPGQSGGNFDKQNFKIIRQCKSLFPSTPIHVDGGVNNEVAFVLRNMGVSAVVSGSYLVNAEGIGKALHNLRKPTTQSHTLVEDIMIERNELPVLKQEEINLKAVLQKIEEFKLGFLLVEDYKQTLVGVITNADVRKALIKNINDLNNVTAVDLINTKPAKTGNYNSITEMLIYLETLPFSALFLPVVDTNKTLVGAVTFTNLIKGAL